MFQGNEDREFGFGQIRFEMCCLSGREKTQAVPWECSDLEGNQLQSTVATEQKSPHPTASHQSKTQGTQHPLFLAPGLPKGMFLWVRKLNMSFLFPLCTAAEVSTTNRPDCGRGQCPGRGGKPRRSTDTGRNHGPPAALAPRKATAGLNCKSTVW